MSGTMRITVDADDLEHAETRPIVTKYKRFVHDHQTKSSLTAQEFYEEGLYSCATESQVLKLLGLPRRLIDDNSCDLPGAEVTTCAVKHWGGRPYIVSRVVRQRPRTHFYYPTLTGFRVPGESNAIELRYFIEPEMLPLRMSQVFGRDSGKQTTRWLVERFAAREKNAHVDVWQRLEQTVQQALARRAQNPHTQNSGMTAASLTQAILNTP